MSKEERDLKTGEKAYFKRYLNAFEVDSKKLLAEIENLKKQLVEGSENVYSFEEIEEYKRKIAELHDYVLTQNEDGETVLDELEEFKKTSASDLKDISENKNQITKYINQVFGYVDDEGKKVPGLKQKIEGIQNQLANNIEANEKKQQALLAKIEELLQGASTVALAKAFEEHKKEFDAPNKLWQNVFVRTLFVLMGFTWISFLASNAELKDMWKITLGNLPFIGAGVWLAIYASKQRSQNIRLQQEYAYKEDVAKLYYGLKNEIEQLDNTELGQRLNESLIQILVDTVSYNPSKTLDNQSHNDKGPLLEALKSISEAVKIK
jgi:uncharacterized protein YoxC